MSSSSLWERVWYWLPPLFYMWNALVSAYVAWWCLIYKNRFEVKGKHVYITGGSSGLGRATALALVRRGAHITIVARDSEALKQVGWELSALAGPDQKILTISGDLTCPIKSENAIRKAADYHGGRCPDIFLLCAGMSRPKYFVDASSEDLQKGMDGSFWVSAYTAHSACKLMVSQKVQGKVVFVSSFLGYTTFAGYSTYSPAKYALRGLADALRSEMLLHDISVHIFMPAGIRSPGYEAEQVGKPAVTVKIEEGDKVISPEECAGHLIRGLEKGYYQPSSYFLTDLVRTQCRGAVPGNNPFLESLYWSIGGLGLPVWRIFSDWTVRGFKKEVQADLEARGFYRPPGNLAGSK